MIGSEDLSSEASSQIYLIDYGVSQRYLNQHGTHIEEKSEVPFRGNFLFASPFALIPLRKYFYTFSQLNRIKPTRRPDLSCLFALLPRNW